MKDKPRILPSLPEVEVFLLVGVAGGILEALAILREVELSRPHWGGLLLEGSLLFPLLMLPQAILGYCLLGVVSRLPMLRALGHRRFRLGFCATSAALLLPLALDQNIQRPGFSFTLYHLGPYLGIAAGVLVASIVAGLLVTWLSAGVSGGRRSWIRPIARGAAALAIGVCGIQYALDRSSGNGAPLPSSASGQDRPNIVLITVDTIRTDHMRSYGYEKNTDPEIQRYFRDGLRFLGAVSPIAVTRPTHSSILTGIHPMSLGLRWNAGSIPENAPTLASELAKNGYDTGGFISGFPLFADPSGLDRGFRVYSDTFHFLTEPHYTADILTPVMLLSKFRLIDTSERDAASVTDDALRWLETSSRSPYFLWIHYYDPHSYYEPPEEYARKMGLPSDGPSNNRAIRSRVVSGDRDVSPTEARNAIALYDGEIRYMDSQVGRLLDRVRSRGELDETVVLLTADHGETLLERAVSNGWVFDHGRWLDEWELLVPFLIRGPGVPQGDVDTITARAIDVMPTLLGAAGIEVPETLQGRDLLNADPSAWAPAVSVNSPIHDDPSRFSARARGYKYHREMDSGREWLIRLDVPAEKRRNLIDEKPGLARRLRAATEKYPDVRQQQKVGADEAERLRALGYIVEEEEE